MKVRSIIMSSLFAISFSGLHAQNEYIKEKLIDIKRNTIELQENMKVTEMLLRVAADKSDATKVTMGLDLIANELKKVSDSFFKRSQEMREGTLNFLSKTKLLSEVLKDVGIGTERK